MLRKIVFPFLVLAFTNTDTNAQLVAGKNEIGINAGALFYQGDLTPDLVGSYKTARPTVEIYYNRIINPYWSARLNLAMGGLAGDDALYDSPPYMRRRKFNFHSPLAELSGLMVFNVFGNNDNTNVLHFSPYVFAGAAVSFLDIHRDWSKIDSSMVHVGSPTLAGLIKDTTTAPPKAIPVLPVGVGLRYNAFPRIAFTAEARYRFIFTDYLDGFSYSANPGRKDGYYGLTVGAVYNFGKNFGKGSTDCPRVF